MSVFNYTAIKCIIEGNAVFYLFVSIDYVYIRNDFNSRSPLHSAAMDGQLERVKCLLAEGLDINSEVLPNGFTPLFFAIAENRLEIVNYLIEHGADVNRKTTDGCTSLMLASEQGFLDVVKVLITKGANIDPTTNIMNTCLHLAARNGHLAVVNYLIDEGLNIDATNQNRLTPLHLACMKGHLDVVKTLIARGCDINAGGWGLGAQDVKVHNITPLHIALQHGHLDVVRFLVKNGANVNAKTTDETTPLHMAARRGFSAIVDILVKAKCDVNDKGVENASALHLATLRRYVKIVETLTRTEGIEIDARCMLDVNATPLHFASLDGCLPVVKLLLEANADINIKQEGGFAPLHLAVQQGHEDVADYLIKSGANIHATTDDKWTPLHLALAHGHENVADHLIKSGANIHSTTDDNWTPLHFAVGNCRSLKIVKALVVKGANVDAEIKNEKRVALHLATEFNIPEIVDFLIENKADVNARTDRFWTPLHFAAYDGYFEIAKSLLNAGGYVDAETLTKTTPLHFALQFRRSKVARLLLERGANVNATNTTNHKNWTLLHDTAEKGEYDLTALLLKYGADLNVKESRFEASALHLAVHHRHPDVVDILIEKGADVNAKMKRNVTPLHFAVKLGYFSLSMCKTLIAKGAHFDAKCETYRFGSVTPLDMAKNSAINSIFIFPFEGSDYSETVEFFENIEMLFEAVKNNNNLEVMQRVAKERIIINAKNSNGWTPLHFAVHYGNTKIADVLLKNGARANDTTNKGNTSLHIATLENNKELVEKLLSFEKSSGFVNGGTTVSGSTALHVAARNGSRGIVASLLRHGAMHDVRSKEGKSPLECTRDRDVRKLLQAAEDLFRDARDGNLGALSKLEAMDGDEFAALANARNDEGRSLVQVAILNKQNEFALAMLEILKAVKK